MVKNSGGSKTNRVTTTNNNKSGSSSLSTSPIRDYQSTLSNPGGGGVSSTIKSIKSNSSLKSIKSIGSSSGPPFLKMKILPIRALSDNYMYLLIDEVTRHAACIDPVNASAISSAVYDQNAELKAILTTHHHHDHAGGNRDMVKMFPELSVYGGDQRIPELEKKVNHGDIIKLGTLTIECLSTPCHTRGHICYYVTSEPDRQPVDSTTTTTGTSTTTTPGASNTSQQQQQQHGQDNTIERAVFTGDTLFIAGCGRFFEGTSEQMDHNLNNILGGLPSDTKVYCGHEYTVTNLKFALSVEPANIDIKNKLQWAQNKVTKKEPTVPSSIGEEKKINPFMRIRSPSVKKYAGETDELEVMSVLRQRKNDFGSGNL